MIVEDIAKITIIIEVVASEVSPIILVTREEVVIMEEAAS